ncbi:MAG: hypothetical protein HYX61_13485 [Gammaproteobacteria bacterium]|jgi:hypothetical protein|nr:hypothetical protein [Gammaproteobacteria bacterium]
MKVTLDLEQLLADEKITQQEYNKLKVLATQSTGSLAFSILIGFGVIAVSGAALALVPAPITAIIIGAAVLIGGISLLRLGHEQWKLLAQICILVGALMLAGGIVVADDGNARSFIAIAAIYSIAAVFAHSSLLTVLAVLSIGPILGASTGYGHATYMLSVQEPLLSIIVFSFMGVVFYWLSTKLPLAKDLHLIYSHLAIIASRTCLFMVNLGFWIGSLWGDKLNKLTATPVIVSDVAFSVVWAIALIATGIWAWQNNRRWVVNVVAIFGGIHFYTQWFEHLSASAGSVLMAGVLALVFALMIKHLNSMMTTK